MPADLTREEIARLPDVLAEMESRLHFGGDPEDDRPATEVWSELWFCDADHMVVFKAARSTLSEPARITALEAENAALREGLDSILSQYVKTLDAGAGNYDGKAFAESLPEVRRARASSRDAPMRGDRMTADQRLMIMLAAVEGGVHVIRIRPEWRLMAGALVARGYLTGTDIYTAPPAGRRALEEADHG